MIGRASSGALAVFGETAHVSARGGTVPEKCAPCATITGRPSYRGDAYGGAICSQGELALVNCTLVQNRAERLLADDLRIRVGAPVFEAASLPSRTAELTPFTPSNVLTLR